MSPGFVRLANKPGVASLPKNNKKIALIVRDNRPPTIQKSNMCGVNHQTIFTIPVAPLFLAHREHLDQVVVSDMKERLEGFGYDVISTYPEAARSQGDKKYDPRSGLSSAEQDAAWNSKDEQKEDKKTIKKWKKATKKSREGGGVVVEALEEKQVSPWGPEFNTKGADVVVDAQIMKFWTEYTYWGSLSWMSVKYAVCDPNAEVRTVLYGNKLRGMGYWFSFFTPLAPSADATVSVNAAYWGVMKDLDKEMKRMDVDKLKAQK